MEKLFKSVLSIREIKFRVDDDHVDRLSRQHTVIILVCFGFLVSTKQFVGKPINCWCPAQFTDSHREYADSICWVSNTYYLPMSRVIPDERFDPQQPHTYQVLISYYQWVPLILLFQALLAFVPCLVWRFVNKRSGVNMAAIMDAARHSSQAHYLEIREKTVLATLAEVIRVYELLTVYADKHWNTTNCSCWTDDDREKLNNVTFSVDRTYPYAFSRMSSVKLSIENFEEQAIRYIVNQMDRYLLAQREYRTGCMVRIKHFIAKMCCIVGGKLYGNYLVSGYMAVKLMYLANAVGQLFLLDAFLKIDYHLYGVHVVEQLIRGQDWSHSERFPRVTLCEFEVRHQSRVHQYVVQCALTINLFNEKLFIFVWFWYVFLAFITTVNSLRWLFRSLYWPGHVQYLRKQLRAFDATQREAGTLAKFAENYLRRDGMFIVRLIGMNMGEVAAGEVICGLWNNYSIERRTIAEKSGRKGVGKSRTGVGGQRVEVV